MDGFLKFFFAFMSYMLDGYVQILTGIVNGVGKIQFETLIVFGGLFGKIIKKSLGVEGYDYLFGIGHMLSPYS